MIKPHPVFDSLWYNMLFCIVAVVMLVIHMSGIITKGFSDGPTGNFIIWTIISFHFIQKVYFCLKARKN